MTEGSNTINKSITFTSVICCAVFIIATMISPEGVKGGFDKLFKFFTGNFGWTYLVCVAGFVLFCFVLTVPRFCFVLLFVCLFVCGLLCFVLFCFVIVTHS